MIDKEIQTQSLFKKAQEMLDQKSGRVPAPSSTTAVNPVEYDDLVDLVDRVNEHMSTENRTLEQTLALQIEVQTRSLIMLKMIDWKLWEIYTKFIR